MVLGHVVVTVWHCLPVCGLKVAWGCGGSWWWQTLADGRSSAPDVVLPSRNVQQQQGPGSPASQLAALSRRRRGELHY